MKQFGEAEWNKMSEKERQKELTKMKLLERQLRREGRVKIDTLTWNSKYRC